MEKKELRSIALHISEGLLRTATDVILYTYFLTVSSIGKSPTSRGTYQAFEEADCVLSEINYDTIKRALVQLHRKHLISYKRGSLKETLSITKEGKARLRELFPTYKKNRTWDGRIYLITYDVPEFQKQHREILRTYIKRLGGAMLQESVWITPYNPHETLRSFINERDLSGVVIISDLGKDATIGEENTISLIRRLYHLDTLNDRYKKWIRYVQKTEYKSAISSTKYLSILRDDPQLPFTLLPADWVGDKAFSLYQKYYYQYINF